ncbi:MAG TPA: ABC transporter substrate-binding protein, partial [Usitatibacter sp.]|nr:ABC transporter substrate-binding protein [Usitatibacter sp.]
QVFRYASAFEPGTMDPHAVASAYTTRVTSQIFDSLLARDERFAVAPALATSWTAVQPTVWRFKLRPGVKFHDGTAFGADDVVFSIERALSPTSGVRFNIPNVTGARKVDALTVDIVTSVPTPILPNALTNFRIMSKAWSVKHKVERPQDFQAKEETYAARNAMGTGPYKLKEWAPDVKTVLVANPDYWGPRGNVKEIHYLVIGSAATRLAGLVSGELDFVIDPALQDVERLEKAPGVKLEKTVGRSTQLLGFDMSRDKLLYGDAGGTNPFKDVRVRRAVRLAIDSEALQAKIMRNLGVAGRAIYSPAVEGYDPRFSKRPEYDPQRARTLLKEAGYPDGFAVTLHCSAAQPSDALCQAVSSMLARVGIRVSYQALPFNTLLPRVTGRDVSFYSIGWSPSTDAEGALVPLVHSPNAAGDGEYNVGRYSSPAVDAMIDRARVEPDPAKRHQLLVQAMTAAEEDAVYVTLTHRSVFWAMRKHVKARARPNDILDLRYVNVEEIRARP